MLQPNFNTPDIVYICTICQFQIYAGDTYYKTESGTVCTDCTAKYLYSLRQVAYIEDKE